MSDYTKRGVIGETVPTLWFDSRGCGPDHLAFELFHFPAEMDGAIPVSLGLRIKPYDLVIGARALVDGGFNLGREQVELLHRQLGEWLQANPPPAPKATRPL